MGLRPDVGLRVAVKSANTCCLPAGGRRADRLLLAGRGAGGECRYLSSKPSHWGLEYADAPVPGCPPLLLLPSPGLPCPCRSCQASLSDTPPPPPPPCRELPRPRAAQAPPNGKLQPTPGSRKVQAPPWTMGTPMSRQSPTCLCTYPQVRAHVHAHTHRCPPYAPVPRGSSSAAPSPPGSSTLSSESQPPSPCVCHPLPSATRPTLHREPCPRDQLC